MNLDGYTNRQKLLYGALAVIGVLYVGDVGYRKLYEEPILNADRKFSAVRQRLEKQKLENAKAKKSVTQVDELQKIALPRNLELARSTYQAWLLQLVKDCELDSPKVDSGNPTPRSHRRQLLYNRFIFTVRGRGNLKQVTRFLHAFYSAGNLHKIQSLTLTPSGENLDISASIEALSLPGADREDKLTEQSTDRLAMKNAADYHQIATRNLFQNGGEGVGRFIHLSAITTDRRGDREAWFHNHRNNQTLRLKKNGSLTVGAVSATVVDILEKTAVVRIDDRLLRVPMGSTLSEAEIAE